MPDVADVTTRGGRLRAAREAAGLSVAALADVLTEEGVEDRSTAQISRYENNTKAAPLEYVELLARLAGYSLDWIVLGTGDRGTAKDVIRRLRGELEKAEADYVVQGATALSAEDALLAAQGWGLQNQDATKKRRSK